MKLISILIISLFLLYETPNNDNLIVSSFVVEEGVLNGIKYTKSSIEKQYDFGKEYISNKTIIYINGMEKYIQEQYMINYPYEMALCIEANVTDNELLVYGYTPVRINKQDENSVNYNCMGYTDNTITLHSHVNIIRVYDLCMPSVPDFSSNFSKYNLIVCGNSTDVVDSIIYIDEV